MTLPVQAFPMLLVDERGEELESRRSVTTAPSADERAERSVEPAVAEGLAARESLAAPAHPAPPQSLAAPGEPAAAPEHIRSFPTMEGLAPASTPSPRVAPRPAGVEEEELRPVDPSQPASVLEALLRSPEAFLRQTEASDLWPLLRSLLVMIGVGGGLFGLVVGAFRGGVQVAYAAVKVPLLLLLTMAICAPAFVGLARAMEVRLSAREVVVTTLGACARFALVLAGLAPVVWLLEGWCGYHATALVITGVCAVAGLVAAALLRRGLRRRGASGLVALAFLGVFGVVGAQSSWLLRPFLVRPRTEQVPFLRSLEGDLLDAVSRSGQSAAGHYEEREP